MRFNDMIATVLAASAERPEAVEAQWRQLVDLLAQPQPGAPDAARAGAYAFLRDNRGRVGTAVRTNAAASLAGLAIDPDLLVFFAEDRAEVAAPLLRSARLRRDDWLAALPRLGPTARALLRHRRDLPGEARRALAAFGPADLVLGPTDAADAVPAEQGGSQIRELVERIEAYQRRRRDSSTEAAPTPGEPASAFRWETGAEGVICWVDEAPRAPLIGLSVAAREGANSAAAAAFEMRAPFRDAALCVAGEGSVAGEWRISGVPYFDRGHGAFLGYRGSARRPRPDEAADGAATPFGPELPPDSLRQLVHELRTPLNAIMGFAELIEGEFMGPAAIQYRDRATDIMGQARRLLSTVDDLDTAARLETHRLEPLAGRADLAVLVDQLAPSYEAAARHRGAVLVTDVAVDLPDAALAPELAERVIARLLAATIGLARDGETVVASLDRDSGASGAMLCFAIDRPAVVAGLGEAQLLDPTYTPAGDWPAAPSLGLGFALSLIRRLVQARGGELIIEADKVRLLLPIAPSE